MFDDLSTGSMVRLSDHVCHNIINKLLLHKELLWDAEKFGTHGHDRSQFTQLSFTVIGYDQVKTIFKVDIYDECIHEKLIVAFTVETCLL